MRCTNGEKGITLIALTITIIVLLILASIATYTGLSTIKSSKLTRFKQELEIMQAHVDKLYEECKNSDGTLDMDKVNAIGKDLTNLDIEEINNIFDSLNIDNTDDYRYFDKETLESLGITGLDDEYLVSIKDRNVISRYGFENDGIMYRNLYQFPDKERISGDINRGDVSFLLDFQKVSDGWNINVTNIKFSKYVGKGNIKYKKSDSYDWITVEENAKQSDYSFKVTSSGKYIVKVTDAAGISAEQEITIRGEGEVTDETPWEIIGDGTEDNPYLIQSIEDLVVFSNSVNEGNKYRDKYVKLERTLDFNSNSSYCNPNTKVSEKTNRIIKEDSTGFR